MLRATKRTARLAATAGNSFFRGYSSALVTATTMVNGKGGGDKQATTRAQAPYFSNRFRSASNLFSPASFLMPASPARLATRSKKKTPRVEPQTADAT